MLLHGRCHLPRVQTGKKHGERQPKKKKDGHGVHTGSRAGLLVGQQLRGRSPEVAVSGGRLEADE